MNLPNKGTISAYDFGAQDVYEIEYPMFLRNQNVVALIVIDLNEYKQEKHDELVTRWLLNCVLCAECQVIFVPSKCDKLKIETKKEKISLLKQGILTYVTDEINFLKHQEVKLKPERGENGQADLEKVKQSIDFFNELQKNVTIKSTSAYTQIGLDGLKEAVKERIDIPVTADIPEIYRKVIDYILDAGKSRQFHVVFDEILAHFNKDSMLMKTFKWIARSKDNSLNESDLRWILDFYRRKGWILWYENCAKYIYVNIDSILKVHRKLYRHDLEEFLQYKFKDHSNIISDQETFDQDKHRFLRSGLLSTELLKCIWKEFNLNDEDFDSMIQLLIANDHCFEDPLAPTSSKIKGLQFSLVLRI